MFSKENFLLYRSAATYEKKTFLRSVHVNILSSRWRLQTPFLQLQSFRCTFLRYCRGPHQGVCYLNVGSEPQPLGKTVKIRIIFFFKLKNFNKTFNDLCKALDLYEIRFPNIEFEQRHECLAQNNI